MELGKAIKLKRIEKDMTQAELGKKVGLCEVTICHTEKGKSKPHKEALERICKELGIDPSKYKESKKNK